MHTHKAIQLVRRFFPLLLLSAGLLLAGCDKKEEIQEPVSEPDESGDNVLTRPVESSIPLLGASGSVPPGEWYFCLQGIKKRGSTEPPREFFIPGVASEKKDGTYLHLLLPEGTPCIDYVVRYVINEDKKTFYDLGFTVRIKEDGSTECTDVFDKAMQLFGKGTADWPYKISSLEDIAVISAQSRKSDLSGVYFLQLCDINCNEIPNINEENGGIAPIGMTIPFKGHYDGDTLSITDLKLVASGTTSNVGLFSAIDDDATIKNLTMKGSNMLSMQVNIGGIAGRMLGKSTIHNCHVQGGTITGINNVGGIVGLMQGGTVTNCSSTQCSIQPNNANNPHTNSLGGLIGCISPASGASIQVKELTCNSNITGHENVGGIIGFVGGDKIGLSYLHMGLYVIQGERSVGGIIGGCTASLELTDCDSRSLVSSFGQDMRDYGGIIGAVGTNGTLLLKNCTNGYKGTQLQPDESKKYTEGKTNTGGLIGVIRAEGGATLNNCKMAANVSGTICVGGLVGHTVSPLTITGCTNAAKEVKATTSHAGGLVGYTTSDISIAGTCHNSSHVVSNGSFAGGFVGCTDKTVTLTGGTVVGNVEAGGQYSGGFVGYANSLNASEIYLQESIIKVSGSEYQGGLAGKAEKGQIKKVRLGFKIGRDGSKSASSGGIIGFLVNGAIDSCFFCGSVQGGQYTGGIAGRQNGGDITNCDTKSDNKIVCNAVGQAGGIIGGMTQVGLNRCHNEIRVENPERSLTGGIVGYIDAQSDSKLIQHCRNFADVSGGDQTGGILGGATANSNNNTQITLCHNHAKITGGKEVGGISGSFSQGQMLRCSNRGVITGTRSIGGIAGCIYKNGGHILECFNIARVNGPSCAGGIIGYIFARSNAVIENCYNHAGVGDCKQYGSSAGILGATEMYAYAKVYYCYSGGTDCTGYGIAGSSVSRDENIDAEFKHCHYSSNNSAYDTYNKKGIITRNSYGGLSDQNNFPYWNFNSIWIMKTQPELRNNRETTDK